MRIGTFVNSIAPVGQTDVPGATPPSVLIAALGPVMLRIAGELADGTVTVWTGPETIADYVRPAITRAAAGAGRPTPRIVAMTIMSVTADPNGSRRQIAEQSATNSQLPSYRSILDRQGKSGVHETVTVGDEAVVARAVRQYAQAGATELAVSPFGSQEERARTIKHAQEHPLVPRMIEERTGRRAGPPHAAARRTPHGQVPPIR